MDLNPEEIVAEFGAYYKSGQLKQSDLIAPLYAKNDWDSYFTLFPTDDTKIDKAIWDMDTETRFQKFQEQFLPLGGMSFVPNTIYLANLMLETVVTPDKLKNSALDFLVNNKDLDRTTAPILAIYLEGYLSKSKDSFHRYESFKGVDTALTPGVSTLVGQSIDGIRTQIRKAHLSTSSKKPHTIALGAVPTDPVQLVDYMIAMYDGLPEEIQQNIDGFMMSKTNSIKFMDGVEKRQNGYYLKQGNLVKLPNRDASIYGVRDMNNSNMIWATVRGNAIKGVKNPQKEGVWKTGVKDLKQVQATSDFYLGYGFLNWDWVYDNGQDLS